MIVLIAFVIIVIYKITSNLIKFNRIKAYYKEYYLFLSGNPQPINSHKIQTIELFKDAGVNDENIPYTQAIGYGKIASTTVSMFDNFPSNIKSFAASTVNMFENAEGVFKSRILESFNPIYWINQILFAPKYLLKHVGLDSNTVGFKLSNILFTFIWWTIGIILVLNKNALLEFATKLIDNFK